MAFILCEYMHTYLQYMNEWMIYYDSMCLHNYGPIMNDFFWELIMFIYGNLTYLKNWKTSLYKILY